MENTIREQNRFLNLYVYKGVDPFLRGRDTAVIFGVVPRFSGVHKVKSLMV